VRRLVERAGIVLLWCWKAARACPLGASSSVPFAHALAQAPGTQRSRTADDRVSEGATRGRCRYYGARAFNASGAKIDRADAPVLETANPRVAHLPLWRARLPAQDCTQDCTRTHAVSFLSVPHCSSLSEAVQSCPSGHRLS
jgi:hypothetical protein